MLMDVNQLQEGFVLQQDVFSLTSKPIARKGTVIEEKHIEIFRAFLVQKVNVEPFSKAVSAKKKSEREVADEKEEKITADSFTEIYDEAVKNFQKTFLSWQSGVPLDIFYIRKLLFPLLGKALEEEHYAMDLYKKCKVNEYIYHHSISVSLLSALIAKKLGFVSGEINQIALAGLLSDCGMSKIPPAILNKKEVLNEWEYKEVKQHPIYSYQLIKDIPSLKKGTKICVLQHHERMDGTGYPLGVKGDNFHPFAKIVSFADHYIAMVSPRPFRPGYSPFYVLEELEKYGFGKFDLSVVNVFKKLFVKYMIGRKVKLSDGTVGKIGFINEKTASRPLIQVIDSDEIISLEKQNDLSIKQVF